MGKYVVGRQIIVEKFLSRHNTSSIESDEAEKIITSILRKNQQSLLDIDNLNRTNILNANIHAIIVIK
jgi:hypothetical protein